jgi:ribosome maturation factor RimP
VWILRPEQVNIMITESRVRELAEEKIEGTDLFIVDISVKPGNKIEVLLDRDSGLTIDDCKKLSRHIENGLDRETEDFALDVSSPGVGKPFKVRRQYFKNVGRPVKVTTVEGQEVEGVMERADESGITVMTEQKVEIPGKKGKKKAQIPVDLTFENIRETKLVISFK